jgi:hypothetical protein
MPNLHLLTQTFSQARHASGTDQINGLEPPLTAIRNGAVLPWEAQQTRAALSAWIERQAKAPALMDPRPTSKQVAFAERIARLKRRAVPEECYRDRSLMSRWIDSNRS